MLDIIKVKHDGGKKFYLKKNFKVFYINRNLTDKSSKRN